MEQKRHCLRCKKEIIGNKKKKFCDDKCRTRYFSLRRYYKLRNTPEYQAYRKKYLKQWVEDNRERFNGQMREISRKWQAARRAREKKEKQVVVKK